MEVEGRKRTGIVVIDKACTAQPHVRCRARRLAGGAYAAHPVNRESSARDWNTEVKSCTILELAGQCGSKQKKTVKHMRTTNFGVAELRYEWCRPSVLLQCAVTFKMHDN